MQGKEGIKFCHLATLIDAGAREREEHGRVEEPTDGESEKKEGEVTPNS